MANIFQVNDWDSTISYIANDIVRYSRKYYYAIRSVPAGAPFTSLYFGGVSYNNRPQFLWRPSFNSDDNHSPETRLIQYNGGYDQRSSNNLINTSLLDFDLSFDQRDEAEAAAILHFLIARNGVEAFDWIPPFPFGTMKRFLCDDFSHSKVFYNNNTIKAKFIEKVN